MPGTLASWVTSRLQTVVNLDGLANDAGYFNFLRDGGDVREYLEEEGVEYIADYNGATRRCRWTMNGTPARRFADSGPWRNWMLYCDEVGCARVN